MIETITSVGMVSGGIAILLLNRRCTLLSRRLDAQFKLTNRLITNRFPRTQENPMKALLAAALTICSSPPDHNEQGDLRTLQQSTSRSEAHLVTSTSLGLHITPGTLASLWTSGVFLTTNGLLLDAQWCSPDLLACTPDTGQGCDRDACNHLWVVFAYPECDDDCSLNVTVTASTSVNFIASHINGQLQSGVWAGPADLTLDGHIDLTDLSAALLCPDFNLDGLYDSQDFFDWLDVYFE